MTAICELADVHRDRHQAGNCRRENVGECYLCPAFGLARRVKHIVRGVVLLKYQRARRDRLPMGFDGREDRIDNHVTDDRAESNWSLSVVSTGTADANTAARAAIYVQHALRHDYNLELIDHATLPRGSIQIIWISEKSPLMSPGFSNA